MIFLVRDRSAKKTDYEKIPSGYGLALSVVSALPARSQTKVEIAPASNAPSPATGMEARYDRIIAATLARRVPVSGRPAKALVETVAMLVRDRAHADDRGPSITLSGGISQ